MIALAMALLLAQAPSPTAPPPDERHVAPAEVVAEQGGEHGGHALTVPGYIFHHVLDEPEMATVAFGDTKVHLSKHVISMWIVSVLLVLFLLYAVSKRTLVPRGAYSLVELLVKFIRDEIAIKQIGEHEGLRYTPFLCTAFFFILANNLFGLIPIPGTGTATSNLAVTMVLALFTFVLTQIAGMRAQGVVGYWMHIVPTGVPKWLYPLMIPVEVLGLFTKPFALTVRLFANMIAGHIVIFFLLALTILLSAWLTPVSVAFALAIYMLELFVALVQAYVFTMLSALFIGMASHAH